MSLKDFLSLDPSVREDIVESCWRDRGGDEHIQKERPFYRPVGLVAVSYATCSRSGVSLLLELTEKAPRDALLGLDYKVQGLTETDKHDRGNMVVSAVFVVPIEEKKSS